MMSSIKDGGKIGKNLHLYHYLDEDMSQYYIYVNQEQGRVQPVKYQINNLSGDSSTGEFIDEIGKELKILQFSLLKKQ